MQAPRSAPPLSPSVVNDYDIIPFLGFSGRLSLQDPQELRPHFRAHMIRNLQDVRERSHVLALGYGYSNSGLWCKDSTRCGLGTEQFRPRDACPSAATTPRPSPLSIAPPCAPFMSCCFTFTLRLLVSPSTRRPSFPGPPSTFPPTGSSHFLYQGKTRFLLHQPACTFSQTC